MTQFLPTPGANPPGIERFTELLRGGELAGHSHVVLLGLRTFDTARLVQKINAGFSFQALERFSRNSELSKEELARLVHIPVRTLSRRKRQGRLLPDESDRLLRISRVFACALALFEGDRHAAREWLATAREAFGGNSALEFAGTEIGAREVEALIGRLEYGIPT